MTSQKDQIQTLIAEIDSVLERTTLRLPWVMSGEVAQHRQVLEHVRHYLVVTQQRLAIQEGRSQASHSDLLAHDIYAQSAAIAPSPSGLPPQSANVAPAESTAQHLLQTIMQEMTYLRANLMQPLQADLDAMRQQRELLLQDIQQLEMQRQAHGPAPLPDNQQQMVAEFMQALMARLQETLPQQIAQTASGGLIQALPASTSPQPIPGSDLSVSPSADQLVIKLDSALKVVFEALERNVQAYQESLTQGLERMHGLGQQGEMMFAALVNHLAQQLGREASSYLQSSTQALDLASDSNKGQDAIATSNLDAGIYSPFSETAISPPVNFINPDLEQALADLQLPYPGIELPPEFEVTAKPDSGANAPYTDTEVDATIEDWLQSAKLAGVLDNYVASPGNDANPSPLNLDADLSNIDALLQTEPAAGDSSLPSPTETENTTGVDTAEIKDSADIDAALKLLEQLSSELEEDGTVPPSLEEAEAEISRMLGMETITHADPSPKYAEAMVSDELSEDARDELDEFYESLFGVAETGVKPAEQIFAVNAENPTTGPIDPTITPFENTAQLQSGSEDVDPTLGWDIADAESLAALEDALADPQAIAFTQSDLLGELVPSPTNTASSGLESIEPADAALLSQASQIQDTDPSVPSSLPSPEDIALLTIDADSIHPVRDLAEDAPPNTIGEIHHPPATDVETQALFDQTLSNLQPPVSPAAAAPASSSEERYTPASPEESLLPDGSSLEQAATGLWLDETTLTSLSEDLSNLEQTPFPEAQPIEPASASEITDSRPSESANRPNLGVNSSIEEYPSLDELAATLPAEPVELVTSTASDESPSAPEVSEEVLTLDGMDDLFGELPPSRTVAVQPSVLPSDTSSIPFTLEGIGDLFADLPTAPSVSEVAPPAALPPVEPTSLPNPVSPPVTTSTSFTLEGMDDLFTDVPASVSAAQASAAEAASVQPHQLGHADNPPDSTTPPVSQVASVAADQPMTLEEMGGLFADAAPVQPTPVSQHLPVDQRSQFTLEQVGDVLMEMPTARGIEPSLHASDESTPAASFTLEQVGDLFVEVPATQAIAPTETQTNLEDTGAGSTIPQADLNQAFESLMGVPAVDATVAENDSPQGQEKKKQAK